MAENNRKYMLSWLLAVALIGIALLLGALRGFSQERAKIEQSEKGRQVAADLKVRGEQAANLTVVAKRYLAEDNGQILAVTSARNNLIKAATRETNDALTAAAGALIDTLKAQDGVTQDDLSGMEMIRGELAGRMDALRRSAYNDQARKFNLSLTGFPAVPFAKLAGIKPLPVYD